MASGGTTEQDVNGPVESPSRLILMISVISFSRKSLPERQKLPFTTSCLNAGLPIKTFGKINEK